MPNQDDVRRAFTGDKQLSGADFRNADFRNADFSGATLSDANFSGANLSGANLGGANLGGAGHRPKRYVAPGKSSPVMFRKPANLRRADLSNADLSSADLQFADLRGADLRGAKLHFARLLGADLRGADLTGADLSAADLRSAKLWRAKLGVTADATTKWPLSVQRQIAKIPPTQLVKADNGAYRLPPDFSVNSIQQDFGIQRQLGSSQPGPTAAV